MFLFHPGEELVRIFEEAGIEDLSEEDDRLADTVCYTIVFRTLLYLSA